MKSFTSLGSKLTSDGRSKTEIVIRVNQGKIAFNKSGVFSPPAALLNTLENTNLRPSYGVCYYTGVRSGHLGKLEGGG